jgi:hypothetical protein
MQCWSFRTLAGSCSLLAMLRRLSAGAHSRNVLSLDIETVALLLRHGERFDFRVMWKGYRDRGSWCCCWLVWSLRCCSRRCEYSSEVWCVHVGTSAALAMSAWRSASISNSPMPLSSADYRLLAHTNESVLKGDGPFLFAVLLFALFDLACSNCPCSFRSYVSTGGIDHLHRVCAPSQASLQMDDSTPLILTQIQSFSLRSYVVKIGISLHKIDIILPLSTTGVLQHVWDLTAWLEPL